MKYKLEEKYNSLDRLERWDKETQAVIKKRINDEVGLFLVYNFFSDEKGEILEIVIDALIPQEKNENYIKISEVIDRELAEGKKGVCYGSNPWPQEFYETGLQAVENFSRKNFQKPVINLNFKEIEKMIAQIMEGKTEDFLYRFLRKVLSDSVKIYYSHPKAWNEVGFPGPAYPEGYAYLDCGQAFSWEPKYNGTK